jgi:hypothetical protein
MDNRRMTYRLLRRGLAALLCACAFAAPDALPAPDSRCAATARQAPDDARIRQAIDEARRQHQLFGGQVIERNGGIFRVGHQEAEWSRPAGDSTPAWERVATFWRALGSDAPVVVTSAGRMGQSEALRAAAGAGTASAKAEVAAREALLRAAIVDTPWSAAFISYVMRTAGFSAAEFEFSESHADYVRAALDASSAEAAGRPTSYVFRACDVASTPPRAGDLLCATRASTAGTMRFDELAAAMSARSAGQAFPMHCDLVVRSDEGGDAKLDTIGGNVVNSVTLSRMTLNARKVLGAAYITAAAAAAPCVRSGTSCREHLSRRPWLVLLQFRD